jgi:hypothetical protein
LGLEGFDQALGMATPASPFIQATPGRPADTSALSTEHGGDWISPKVTTNGIISVAWQEINCGKHRAGYVVDIHQQGPTMQVFDGEELLKTVLRTSTKEVRKRRAERVQRAS